MWGTILSLVLGAVPGVIRELAAARVNLANAETEKEKVEANERIKALEAKRDVLIAESATPWNVIARFCLLGPAAFYLFWISAYDKIICKWVTAPENVNAVCTTDPLSDWQMGIVGIMVGFYFLTDVTKIMKR